jgi:hypothetical protein
LKPEISRQEADCRGLCRHRKEYGRLRRDCPKLWQQPTANAMSLIPDLRAAFEQVPLPSGQIRLPTVNKLRQGYAVKDATLDKPKLQTPVDKEKIAIATGEQHDSTHSSTLSSLPKLEEPVVAQIRINNVEARCLIDTKASGDFISSHVTFVNHLKHRKLDSAIPIQQAVKGSKPKCNAVATFTPKFGDLNKKTSMYVVHLANYDAIISFLTLTDAGARSDLATRTLYLQQYELSLPLERYQPVSRPRRHLPDSKQSDRQTPSPEVNATSAEEEVAISASPPAFTVPEGIEKNGSAEYYRNLICERYLDLFFDKLPAQLPPLRAVNHHIPVKIDKPWMALYTGSRSITKRPSKTSS